MTISARISDGKVVPDEPIPFEWEGQCVQITTQTPDDPMPDLAERLAALHALGAMEWAPGDGERIEAMLADINAISKLQLEKIASTNS